MSTVDEVLAELAQAGANTRCKEIKLLLESLGFEVEKRSSGEHYTFTHPRLPEFHGSGFAAEHGRNGAVKRAYIGNIRRTIRQYEDELRRIYG